MRYVAAYLLAVLGGKTSPSANDIKSILKSVGIDADDERVKKVISELSGKDLEDVVNSGLAKLSSVPSGGAVSAAPASAPAAGGAAPAEKIYKMINSSLPDTLKQNKPQKQQGRLISDTQMLLNYNYHILTFFS
uniref:Large ribosomal subunit protein P2 n=1 Tax=Xenopus tropicalis TaxID=8364 RepID=A0A803JQS2_XENTR